MSAAAPRPLKPGGRSRADSYRPPVDVIWWVLLAAAAGTIGNRADAVITRYVWPRLKDRWRPVATSVVEVAGVALVLGLLFVGPYALGVVAMIGGGYLVGVLQRALRGDDPTARPDTDPHH